MAVSPDLTGYTLTFDDEFSSATDFKTSPDGSSGYQTTYYFGGRELWSNGDLEYFSDPTVGVNPFDVSNGALHITASPATTPNPDNQPYNSGMITTEGMFSQSYGYFEARVEVAQGPGMWSAFWMLPENKAWPPEIDALEAFGATNPNGEGGANLAAHVNHAPTANDNIGGWATVDGNIWTSYHTYGVDWEPDTITWYIDGKAIQQIPTPAGESNPMYMILNLAVGGWPGNPAGETSVMSVDYLRAYSKDPSATAVHMAAISSPDGVDTTPYGASDASGVIGGAVATGPANLTVRVSEDAFNGDAKFIVTVDGAQISGIQTATASHAAGQWQDIDIAGAISTGPHSVGITFINDAWGGSTSTDRNLYVQSVTINGDTIPYTAASNTASNGQTAPDGAVLAINGTATFTDGTPSNSGTSGGDTTGGGTSTPPPTDPGTGDTGGTVSGPLTLHVSEDAWNGDAQFTVLVDGVQFGGTQTVTASHAAGQWQDITIAGTLSSGSHTVAVNFINDGWGGSAATDRNMYVQSITVNGETIPGTVAQNTAANGGEASDPSAAVMDVNGTATFHAAGTATSGTGTVQPSTIVFHMAEDAWNGDAQFQVLVDGAQVGGVQTVTASHTAGLVQDFTISGDFGAQGPGHVDVVFLNDAWGGTAATDRNLYVQSIDVNGVHFAGNTALNNAANHEESLDPSAAVMAINGTADFNIDHTAPPQIIG
jgi:beta-glucanase (GH16 family)